ncbi:TetR/AcrR family transcriptional regulator C-terminal domain-containing protein [bacterium]|nr:TetR/AcrR family transcriptional regulator C-terminal domain-containing protein [bacterium]
MVRKAATASTSSGPGVPAKRRKRGTLSRDQLLEAALSIVDAEGYDALSMPKLAREVKAGTMTLYGYVKNKEDLINALVERVLQPVAEAEPDGRTWQEILAVHFRLIRSAALQHPAIGRIIASQGITTPSVVKILNDHLAVLRNAGFKRTESVRLYYALLTYTLGFVAWEIPRVHEQSSSEYKAQWKALLTEVDDGDAPTLHDLKKKLYTVADEEQFEWGLGQILSGVAPASGKK